MNIQYGDMTVGDVGVVITVTISDDTLTGKTISFIFVKPSGDILIKTATVTGVHTATYTTVSSDINESGTWMVYAKDAGSGYCYIKESQNRFVVRPKPEEMAKGIL